MIITIILLCSGLVRGGIHNVAYTYIARFTRTRQPANGLESEVWQRCSRYNNNRASPSGGAPRSPPKNHAGHNILIIILFFFSVTVYYSIVSKRVTRRLRGRPDNNYYYRLRRNVYNIMCICIAIIGTVLVLLHDFVSYLSRGTLFG